MPGDSRLTPGAVCTSSAHQRSLAPLLRIEAMGSHACIVES